MGDFCARASLPNGKVGGELRKEDEGCNYISISKAAVTLTRRNNGGKITHEHPHLVREAEVSVHPNILRRKENE